MRLALQEAGLRVTPQVAIEGVGFVDLLVGTRVIVEVDSELWHSTPAQREEDARRDLALRLRGYVVIRVRYAQAMHDRSAVVESVLANVDTTRTRGVSLTNRRSQVRQN